MDIVSSFRMKEIDRRAIEDYEIPELVLMENAGIRVLEKSLELTGFNISDSIICAAGSGNNGGDALVIARQLYNRGYKNVSVLSVSEKGSEARKLHMNICRNLGIRIKSFPDDKVETELSEASVIFDGITGTGISGALRSPLPQLIELINRSEATKIAIDVPSGTGEKYRRGYPSIVADFTITIGLPLRCLYLPSVRPLCGEIQTVAIGFPEALKNDTTEPDGIRCELVGQDCIDRLMPDIAVDSFKNRRGHLVVIGGGRGTVGAASLCAEAALRTSAGLVSLLVDKELYELYAGSHRSVMVKEIPDGPLAGEAVSVYSAVAVGPGWGVKGRGEPLANIIERAGCGVIDADGINVFAKMIRKNKIDLGGRWILTPHPGEFKRLFPESDPDLEPFKAVNDAARALNCVILLKGHVTYIAEPEGRCFILDGCFPKLGTAGSGDLLTGIIAGYLSSGMAPVDAAILGASVHLDAGKRCGEKRRWFSSEDLLSFL